MTPHQSPCDDAFCMERECLVVPTEAACPEAPEFVVDDEHHQCVWYGKKQPSVNQLLKRAARVFNPWLRDERGPDAIARMERGKRIHRTLELLDKGELTTWDPWYQPWIDGWLEGCGHLGIASWQQREVPAFRVVAPRKAVWGIPDGIATTCAGSPLVVDFKSTESVANGRQQSYRIQVAGYMDITGVDAGAIVYVDPTGAHDIEWVTPRDRELWAFAVSLVGGRA